MSDKITGNTDYVQVAQAVAREVGIGAEIVLGVMEKAIAAASSKKYGREFDLRAEIDRRTGAVTVYRALEVVEEVEFPDRQITLADAKAIDPNYEIGSVIKNKLPAIDLERVAAQLAKQTLQRGIKDAVRDEEFKEFSTKLHEIAHGQVKRIEHGHVYVELGKTEAIIPRNELIPTEIIKPGDRIRAYISDVRREQYGPQVFLSRRHNQFLAKLFELEVPEIYEGAIEVKAVAREPGSRAKMAVYTSDHGIDPVGSCVGICGARVQAVSNELAGEKIDIITWSSEPATFVINALSPAEISKVVVDEDKGRIDVVVAADKLSLAIGRRGQNVRLASQLTGWKIDIMNEEQEAARRQEEFHNATKLFMEALNVDEILAQLLAAEGFNSIEELSMVDSADIASIEGLDEDIATALQERAQEYLSSEQQVQEAGDAEE